MKKPIRYNTFYAPAEGSIIEQCNYSDEIVFFTFELHDWKGYPSWDKKYTVAIWHIKPKQC